MPEATDDCSEFDAHFIQPTRSGGRAMQTTIDTLRLVFANEFEKAADVLMAKKIATPKELHTALKEFHKTLADAIAFSSNEVDEQMTL